LLMRNMNDSRTSETFRVDNSARLDNRSLELRRKIVRMLSVAKRGHIASAFSCVELVRVLYDDVMRYDAANPSWPERDRCIFSKGHGCMALYVMLSEKGFFPESELWKFCKHDGILGGHPEYGKVPGVEASTGSLGHGLPIGIGFALNARHEKAGHRVFVVLGDGECDEGSVWEAAMCASKHRLSNLVVMVDYNKQQSYGSTREVLDLEPLADKWRAFGWAVDEVDGHSVKDLQAILARVPFQTDKPTAIICHTVKGRWASLMEENPAWHHKINPTDEEIDTLMRDLETD
jgi:transketolase